MYLKQHAKNINIRLVILSISQVAVVPENIMFF